MESPEQSGPAPETLDFILDWGRGSLELQLASAEALDSKMAQALAAGSILLGLPALSGAPDSILIAVLLGLAVVAFVSLAGCAVPALWARRFRGPMSPTQAWDGYWSDNVPTIKLAIVADTAEGYEENRCLLIRKRNALHGALAALGAEALLVGAALIVAAAAG